MAQFNATRITERLIIGGGITGPDEMAWLVAQGVTHVISAAAELNDSVLCVPDHVDFLHVPWADDAQRKPVEDFHRALLWVAQCDAQALATNRQVGLYVHCAAGVNRGPLLGTFLLAALAGLGADEAWKLVKGARAQVTAFTFPEYRASCQQALDVLRPFRAAPALPSAEPAAPVAPVAIGVSDGAQATSGGEKPRPKK